MKKFLNLVLMVAILSSLLACTQNGGTQIISDSRLDKNWGRSYESAKYNQILNPDAGQNQNTVEGMDGSVGERVMDSHVKGGKQKQNQPTEFGVVTIKR